MVIYSSNRAVNYVPFPSQLKISFLFVKRSTMNMWSDSWVKLIQYTSLPPPYTHRYIHTHYNSNMLKNNGESYRIAGLAQCTCILAYIAFKQLKAPNLPGSFSPPPTFSAWTVVLAALVWSWGVCWHHRTWHGWAIWPGDPGVSAGDWQWQDVGLSLPLSASMGVIHKVKSRSATTPFASHSLVPRPRPAFRRAWERG